MGLDLSTCADDASEDSSRVTNAHVIISNGKGRIFLIRDVKSGKWGYPGGLLEPGEAPFEAMQREFREETGVQLPDLSNVKQISGLGSSTRVYVGLSDVDFRQLISPDGGIRGRGRKKEADAWKMPKVDDVLTPGKWQLRGRHYEAIKAARVQRMI